MCLCHRPCVIESLSNVRCWQLMSTCRLWSAAYRTIHASGRLSHGLRNISHLYPFTCSSDCNVPLSASDNVLCTCSVKHLQNVQVLPYSCALTLFGQPFFHVNLHYLVVFFYPVRSRPVHPVRTGHSFSYPPWWLLSHISWMSCLSGYICVRTCPSHSHLHVL